MTNKQRKDRNANSSPDQGNDSQWEMVSGLDDYCRSLGQQTNIIHKLHLPQFFNLLLDKKNGIAL